MAALCSKQGASPPPPSSVRHPCLTHPLACSAASPFRPPPYPPPICSLHDVIHAERRLFLVFEYLDLDLKKLMDSMPSFSMDFRLIKVGGGSMWVWM